MNLSDSAFLASRLNNLSMASERRPSFDYSGFEGSKAYSHMPLYRSDSGEVATIIDAFSPRPYMAESISPPSSNSSDSGCHSSQSSSSSRASFETFFHTRSRVIRLFNLPRTAEGLVSALFLPQSRFSGPIPRPVELWALKSDPRVAHPENIWAVYATHEEASSALSLSGPVLSVTTALESDLHPLSLFRRFSLSTGAPAQVASHPHPSLRVSASHPNLPFIQSVSDRTPGMEYGDYTISSNPPNPKNSFRLGDWMCNSPKCAAHNFGRNLSCIGCGCPRSSSGTTPPQPSQSYSSTRANSSPRFAAYQQCLPTSLPSPLPQSSFSQAQQPSPPSSTSYPQPQRSHGGQLPHHHQTSYPSAVPTPPPKTAHPLLTPSGRAFATGGKVQNVSTDPLSPCIMWWPDNEPLPEQGQIRPGSLTGVHQPPILNTGNKGPITHQPGDWVCKKCNYLNWRRRKVCQTCLPYAEGNGDSISAAVQAERIHLLQTVLAHTQGQVDRSQPLPIPHAPRSHSLTPPQPTPSLVNSSPIQNYVQRSHSNVDLASRYANTSPIYQTSGLQRQPSPLYSTGPSPSSISLEEPAPLLPSFLQDIVQSPALSPTSTSSADLSLEDYNYDDLLSATTAKMNYALSLNGDKKQQQMMDDSIANIWRFDGEESKSLGSFALPVKQEYVRVGEKHARDIPRAQLITS